MEKSQAAVDMLHGPLLGKLIRFALPIAASSMLQQLFNAADTAVVGRFADANALAAVGTNSEIVALLVSISLGLAVGANVLLAGLIGKNDRAPMQAAVHTAMLLALLIGAAGALAGQWLARSLLILIHTPASVLDSAVLYLRIYFAGYPALLVYDFGAAILRARGDSRRPFLILACSGAANVLLNLFFVIVCRLGVAGVAAATDLSSLFAAVLVTAMLTRERTELRLSLRHLRLHRQPLRQLLQIGVPAAIQGAVFCFANIFVQSAVNSFGAIAAAGSAIATNFEYFGYYMITAFGQAATTFVSQNHAAGNLPRCRRILLWCLLCAVLCSAAITVPLTVFRTGAARLFSQDEAVIRAACTRIVCILLFEPVCGLYEVPAGYLRGMGHSSASAVLMILGTCLLRIVWVQTVFRHVRTLPCLFSIFPISWLVTSLLLWLACFHAARHSAFQAKF